MVNYGNGKIYQLFNTSNNKRYVGSTANTLSRRFSHHKDYILTKTHRPLYKDMKDNINNFKIILIEDFSCNSKRELEKREFEILEDFIIRYGKENIYNIMVDGKHSEETKNVMSSIQLGENNSFYGKTHSEETKKHFSNIRAGSLNPSFNRGSVCKNKSKNIVIFKWIENGKPIEKSFSINKYGEEQAFKLAEEHRDKVYPKQILEKV